MSDRIERDSVIVPIVEEQAVILKRKKFAEGVRVRTVTHEHEDVVDEPVVTEEVTTERIAIDRWVEGPVPIRQDGDTTIITTVEEVLVVEKRLRAIEEIHVTKRRLVTSTPQRITLRREEAVIERLDADGTTLEEPI